VLAYVFLITTPIDGIWGGLSIGVVYNGDAPGDTVSLKETQLQGQNKKRAEALFVVSYRVVL